MEAGYVDGDSTLAVKYSLPLGTDLLPVNELTGQAIRMEWQGKINCIHCGRETRKSFAQGYCYPCFI
ncbi:MAG TPA: DUF2797 domain-containing protein, partial [Bacteroidales bacterium]|nr:DUF2797 domain-containing protein [Bacteroidales bacterium]